MAKHNVSIILKIQETFIGDNQEGRGRSRRGGSVRGDIGENIDENKEKGEASRSAPLLPQHW